jgi:hypothetical protein
MTEFTSFVNSVPQTLQSEHLIEKASEFVDRFTARVNACNLKGMDEDLYFPHVMLSGA